jgi:hypothetical protein
LKSPWNAGARSAAMSRAATSALRRTCRTRIGRARRGAGVTTGRYAASAWTPPWRLWQVDRARWRQSTGPTHRPRRAIGRRGDARRRPCCGLSTRACVTGVTSPTHNRPSPTIRRLPQPLPRAHTLPPELRRCHCRRRNAFAPRLLLLHPWALSAIG